MPANPLIAMEAINHALQPFLLITYFLGIMYVLSFLYYATQTNLTIPPTNKLYQSKTIFISMSKTALTANERNSIHHTILAAVLLLHGLFTIGHILTLAGIQYCNKKIRLFPFLKATIFVSFLKLGTSLGFVLSLNDKANELSEPGKQGTNNTALMIRLIMSNLTWLFSSFLWFSFSWAYFSMLRYNKIGKLKNYRGVLFLVGDYRGIPVVTYFCAGTLSFIAIVCFWGHWCEPAFVSCFMGDAAAMHQIWVRMRTIDHDDDER